MTPHPVSPMGRLEVALTEAPQRGWTVASMKDDWKRIFGFEQGLTFVVTADTIATPNKKRAHADD